MDAGKRRAAGHVNPTAIDPPPKDSELREPLARSCTSLVILLLCALVVVVVVVRIGHTVVEELGRLSKDEIDLDIAEMHYEMPTRHCFTDSEEEVSMLEQVLDRDQSVKSPGLKSLTEILRKRVREAESSAMANHKLLTESIPSYCGGIWSTSAESKAKANSLKHYVKHLTYQAGHPASRIRDALGSTQKIRLIVDDELNAIVTAIREYDNKIDQTYRGWGAPIAWFSSRSRDPADYVRLQARRHVHEKTVMALDNCDRALRRGLPFWAGAQMAIEVANLTEKVGRLESMVEEGPLDWQMAEEILRKVLKVVQNAAIGVQEI